MLWTTPPEKVKSLDNIWSHDPLPLPPSRRKLSKTSGECWNHYQSAKKLEVKLTQRKIRYLPDGQRQLSRVIASTYKSLLVVHTSNSAWTQVNSELPKDLGHNERQQPMSFPGGNWDAAFSSGNPHGSGMSKCTIIHSRAGLPCCRKQRGSANGRTFTGLAWDHL